MNYPVILVEHMINGRIRVRLSHSIIDESKLNEFFKEEVTKSKEYANYYLEKDSVYSGFNEFTGYKFFRYTLIRLN